VAIVSCSRRVASSRDSPRGPSLANCSAAIAAALLADIEARLEREAAYRRWREEAFRAVEHYPLRVALDDGCRLSQ
jgi:hypothetical protein